MVSCIGLHKVTLPLFSLCALLFSSELDLCVPNIKLFLDRFDMTLLSIMALSLLVCSFC